MLLGTLPYSTLVILGLAALALNSPWGRMMRAIRNNEIAAGNGKDVTNRHRQVFILGSAVIGVAGAMLTTLDGQFMVLISFKVYVLDLGNGHHRRKW